MSFIDHFLYTRHSAKAWACVIWITAGSLTVLYRVGAQKVWSELAFAGMLFSGH